MGVVGGDELAGHDHADGEPGEGDHADLECGGCDLPWPCPTRRRELRAEYADAPVSLALYLGSYLVQAAEDMPWAPAGLPKAHAEEVTATHLRRLRCAPHSSSASPASVAANVLHAQPSPLSRWINSCRARPARLVPEAVGVTLRQHVSAGRSREVAAQQEGAGAGERGEQSSAGGLGLGGVDVDAGVQRGMGQVGQGGGRRCPRCPSARTAEVDGDVPGVRPGVGSSRIPGAISMPSPGTSTGSSSPACSTGITESSNICRRGASIAYPARSPAPPGR